MPIYFVKYLETIYICLVNQVKRKPLLRLFEATHFSTLAMSHPLTVSEITDKIGVFYDFYGNHVRRL